MEIGGAIAIMVTSAIILAVLFTLVSAYFSYRFRKERYKLYESYELIESTELHYNHLDDQQYEEFISKRKKWQNEKKRLKQMSKGKRQKIMFETTLSNQPFYQTSDNNFEQLNIEPRYPERSFKPQKFCNLQLKKIRRKQSGEPELESFENQLNTTHILRPPKIPRNLRQNYQYISSVVSYTEQGLEIIERNLMAIFIEQNRKVLQKKNSSEKIIKQSQPNFKELIQAYGFEEMEYGTYQYRCHIHLRQLDKNRKYWIHNLQVNEQKQEIDFKQFCWQKKQIMQ